MATTPMSEAPDEFNFGSTAGDYDMETPYGEEDQKSDEDEEEFKDNILSKSQV